jgi:hypothetical protein
MRQSIPAHPDNCPRCSEMSVCSDHESFATAERPSASTLLGVVQRDAAAVLVRPFAAGEGPIEHHRDPLVPRPANEWRTRSRLTD